MQIAAVIYIVLAVIIFVGMFVRSRVKDGIPIFKATQQDKAELREFRREFAVRKLLAMLCQGFGIGCFIAAARLRFNHDIALGTAVALVALSLVLLLCATILLSSAR